MKLAPALFAVSVAANVAALAYCVLRPGTPAPASALAAADRAAAPAVVSRPTAGSHSADGNGSLWSTLAAEDPRTLVARLRAAGFPPGLVRAIVEAKVMETVERRAADLLGRLARAPYWRPLPSQPIFGDPAYREAVSAMWRERSRLLRDILGDDFFLHESGNPTAQQRRMFGDLPAGKIQRLQLINDDYDELAQQIRNRTQGFVLPEDREQLALVERERRADLAAVLSAEELADYDLRSSPVTSRLRTALTIVDASEAEFRAIHEAYRKHDALLNPLGGPLPVVSGELNRQRDDAHRQINAELRAALGEARQAELARAMNRDYQSLLQFAARDHVPRENVVRAFDLREHAARESTRIMADTALTTAQKRAAFQQLTESIEADLAAALGPSTTASYLQSAMSWFETIRRGGSFSLRPDGSVRSGIMLPSPRN